MAASRSDGTELPKHAALYICYSMIGCSACLYETFLHLNNYSYRNGSENGAQFFPLAKKVKLNVFYLIKFIIYYFYK
jgi:hypothetical protein